MKYLKTFWATFHALMVPSAVFFPWNYALAQSGRYGGWNMGPGMMGEWGMGWFGMIFMMIFWILLIVGLVFLIRWLIQTTSRGREDIQSGSRAIEILKERYARGEINKQEFEEKRRDDSWVGSYPDGNNRFFLHAFNDAAKARNRMFPILKKSIVHNRLF